MSAWDPSIENIATSNGLTRGTSCTSASFTECALSLPRHMYVYLWKVSRGRHVSLWKPSIGGFDQSATSHILPRQHPFPPPTPLRKVRPWPAPPRRGSWVAVSPKVVPIMLRHVDITCQQQVPRRHSQGRTFTRSDQSHPRPRHVSPMRLPFSTHATAGAREFS